MIKRFATLAAAAALALACAAPAAADSPAATPAASSNVNAQNYANWDASPVNSYLAVGDGTFTRVEHMGNAAVVEEYDASFRLLTQRTIPMELPIWGGYFAGREFNFFVFGQSNPVESDSVEVIRVVKYSKDWVRLGQASIRGANTSVPFYCGSLRMAEAGGYLYIRTSHKMYRSSGGGAQANMTFAVEEATMEAAGSAHLVEDVGCGYVSDSFNQFILAGKDGRLAALDQGDDFAARRAVVSIFSERAGGGQIASGSVVSIGLIDFPLPAGGDYRVTGCSIGGFGETDSKYIAAYSYDGAAVSTGPKTRSVFLAAVDKESGEVTVSRLSQPGASTPQLVTLSGGGGYVLWNGTDSAGDVTDELHYAAFDAQGTPGQVETVRGSLSDCAPVEAGGSAVWYVTDAGAPVFYTLNEQGLQKRTATGGFSDVAESDEMYPAALWSVSSGCLSPVSDSEFGRNVPCSRSAVVLAIWRALDSPKPQEGALPFTDVDPGSEAYPAILWAYQNGVAHGDTAATFSPDSPVKRCDAVTLLFRAAGASAPQDGKNPFSDVPADAYYAASVLWASSRGIAQGVTQTAFSPERAVTRLELAAFLYRLILDQ